MATLGTGLGSTSITANNDGTRTGEIRYNPWGTERYTYGTTPTTYHFTGQRLESALGLYYYGARWYDPALGRFISADSIVPISGSNPEDIRQIQLSLIVDYHELYLLSQINKNNHDGLNQVANSNEEQSSKNQQLRLQQENKYPLQKEYEDRSDESLENLAPININDLSNFGESQPTEDRDHKVQQSQTQSPINMLPYRINSTSLDRFAYVSNCPTSYTDPSGHCNTGKAIAGGAIAGMGLIPFGLGLAIFVKGGLEAAASPALGPAAPLALFHGWEQIVGGGVMMVAGGGFIVIGGIAIYQSDCIQEGLGDILN